MTNTARVAVDLDALAGTLAGVLQDPQYVLTDDFADAFARFDTASTHSAGVGEVTIRATVSLVSDGEDEIAGAEGDVVEIVVRRASA